ncbi:hypothetical protein HSISS3_257 [Streptococcus sp. HSISS3]|nr:hypothetical protein HSISS3_257 [Streptococcus sp. HSISS3]
MKRRRLWLRLEQSQRQRLQRQLLQRQLLQRQLLLQVQQLQQALKHLPLLKRLRRQQHLQQLRRALHHKLQQHQKQQAHQQLQLLKLHKHRLQRLLKQVILLKLRNHAFVHVVPFLQQMASAHVLLILNSKMLLKRQPSIVQGKRGKNKVTQVQFGSIVMVQSITITKKMQNVLLMLMFTFSM